MNKAKAGHASPLSLDELQQRLVQTQQQLTEAQERERRALADYQNLVRRNQEERQRIAKSTAQEVVGTLLDPLQHLNLAAKQLNDQGLDLVTNQFWQRLRDLGLQEIDVMDKEFDVATMEVVEKKGDGNKVIDVRQPGYTLHGEVLQHAKVVVG